MRENCVIIYMLKIKLQKSEGNLTLLFSIIGGAMAYSKIEKLVFDMAMPIADENGCYIYDVEYVKEGAQRFLRLYIDKEEGGVSLDDCEIVSRALSSRLDETDPIKENYVLEVSSPGIERKLRQKEHFERYIGCGIDIGLYKPLNGSKVVFAVLEGFDEAEKVIKVQIGEQSVDLPLADTTYIRLHFDF